MSRVRVEDEAHGERPSETSVSPRDEYGTVSSPDVTPPTTLDDLEGCLRMYMAQRLGIRVRDADLDSTWALIARPHKPLLLEAEVELPSDPLGVESPARGLIDLVVSRDLEKSQRIYLYIHAAAHVLLGVCDNRHGGLGRTIVEPGRDPQSFRPLLDADPESWRLHAEADRLASAIVWNRCSEGCEGEAGGSCWTDSELALSRAMEISALVPGERSRLLRAVLSLGIGRGALLHGLRLARAAHSAAGRPLGATILVDWLRSILCVTEVIVAAPTLADAAQSPTERA